MSARDDGYRAAIHDEETGERASFETVPVEFIYGYMDRRRETVAASSEETNQ